MLLLAALQLCAYSQAPNIDFIFRNYQETLAKFNQLAQDYPDMIEVFDALERWPDIAKNVPAEQLPQCNGQKCKWLVAHITNKAEYKKKTLPEMYISGCLHGDELIGPNIATGLAEFLLAEYQANHETIRHLLNTRSLWITPMTNAEGYSKEAREEIKVDPNRDFPYNNHYGDGACMHSIAARVVAELYKAQMIQISVTFHAGIETLNYMWGSPPHSKERYPPEQRPPECEGQCTAKQQRVGCCVSYEAPDASAFKAIGVDMWLAYGKTADQTCQASTQGLGAKRPHKVNDGCWYLPAPTASTDTVYAVNGGLEDFSYAYSWENSVNTESESVAYTNPIPAECSSDQFGGYTMRQAEWKQSVKQVNYLIESTASKATKSGYGSSDEVYRKSTSGGHVARSVRMLIRLLELLQPEVMFTPDLQAFYGFGCHSFKARLVKWAKSGVCTPVQNVTTVQDFPSTKCLPLQRWQHTAQEHATKFPFAKDQMLQMPGVSDTECFAIVASFDAEWAQQGSPHPKVTPQTHLVRARTEDAYEVPNAKNAGPHIAARRERFFLISASQGNVGSPAGNVPAPAGNVPAPAGNVPAPAGNVPAPAGNVPGVGGNAPGPAGNGVTPVPGTARGDAKPPGGLFDDTFVIIAVVSVIVVVLILVMMRVQPPKPDSSPTSSSFDASPTNYATKHATPFQRPASHERKYVSKSVPRKLMPASKKPAFSKKRPASNKNRPTSVPKRGQHVPTSEVTSVSPNPNPDPAAPKKPTSASKTTRKPAAPKKPTSASKTTRKTRKPAAPKKPTSASEKGPNVSVASGFTSVTTRKPAVSKRLTSASERGPNVSVTTRKPAVSKRPTSASERGPSAPPSSTKKPVVSKKPTSASKTTRKTRKPAAVSKRPTSASESGPNVSVTTRKAAVSKRPTSASERGPSRTRRPAVPKNRPASTPGRKKAPTRRKMQHTPQR